MVIHQGHHTYTVVAETECDAIKGDVSTVRVLDYGLCPLGHTSSSDKACLKTLIDGFISTNGNVLSDL